MRLTWIIVVAALLAAAGRAHAQEYGARCEALKTFVKDLPGMPQADRDLMTRAIVDYCDKRGRCLADVRRALQVKIDAKVDGAWPACVSAPPLDVIDRGLTSLSDESRFKLPYLQLASIGQQEAAFFQALNGALKSVAVVRDEVAAARGEVDRYTITVRDREWPAVLSHGERFCRELADVQRVPLNEAATTKVRDLIASTRDKWYGILARWGAAKVADIDPADLDTMERHADAMATIYAAERAAARERAIVERAINGGRGTMSLYVTLKEFSAVFISSFKGREAKLVEATGALDKLVAAAAAPGQAEDAKLLASQLRPDLAALGGDYAKAIEAFMNQHDGNVRNLRDKIACASEWKALSSKFANEQKAREIGEFRRQVLSYFELNLGSYRSEVERRLGPAIQRAVAAWERELAAQAEDLRVVDEGLRESNRF